MTDLLCLETIDAYFPNGGTDDNKRLNDIVRKAQDRDYANLREIGAEDRRRDPGGRRKKWPKHGVYLGKVAGNKSDAFTFGGGSASEKRQTVVGMLTGCVLDNDGRCVNGEFCSKEPENEGQPARLTMSEGKYRFVIDADDSARGHALDNLKVICNFCNMKKKQTFHKKADLQPIVVSSSLPKPKKKKSPAKPAAKAPPAAKAAPKRAAATEPPAAAAEPPAAAAPKRAKPAAKGARDDDEGTTDGFVHPQGEELGPSEKVMPGRRVWAKIGDAADGLWWKGTVKTAHPNGAFFDVQYDDDDDFEAKKPRERVRIM